MERGRHISRRALLGAAAGLFVGSVAVIALREGDRRGTSPSTSTTLPRLPSGIAAVGVAYLHSSDAETSAEELRRDLPELAGVAPSDLEVALGRLRDRVREDFASAEVVVLDGWRISRGEARAAALIALDS